MPPERDYDYHVNDRLYANVRKYFPLTGVASSILSLYLFLDEPSDNHRDPVSWEKFVSKVTHYRKAKSFTVDTRRMEVSIPDYQRDQEVVELLATWLDRES
jgi:hypothetical protein